MTTITIAQFALDQAEGVRLDVTYPLGAYSRADKVVLALPEIGEITGVAVPEGMTVQGARVDGEARYEIVRGDHQSFDGASLLVRIEWVTALLNGCPICPLPAALPRLLPADDGRHLTLTRTDDTVRGTPVPRLELVLGSPPIIGHVTDHAGALLMAAIPVGRLRDAIWYADDAIVLAGTGVASISVEQRTAFLGRLRDIHRFLDAELGQGQHVRAIVLCEKGARNYPVGENELVALEDTWFDSTPDFSWFIAERIVVLDMASIWWTYGIRPVGVEGESMALGLAIYAIFRWFEVTGKPEELESELVFWHKRLEKPETGPAVRRAAQVAFALYAANGPALREELRQWCATAWGCEVPAAMLAARLTRVGVVLPHQRIT